MKRDENIYNYGHAAYQQDIVANLVDPPVTNEDIMESHDPKDSFLSIVYAIDERTKLPTGDLNYLVSDRANPEVKKWVLDNIMIDTSGAVTPKAPDGLSDDDIAALARSPKEDINSYLERVNQYMKANKSAYERMAEASKQRVAPGEDVPVGSE